MITIGLSSAGQTLNNLRLFPVSSVNISEEHVGYEWLTFEQAIDKLSFENSRNVLRKAQDFLFNLERNSLRRWAR